VQVKGVRDMAGCIDCIHYEVCDYRDPARYETMQELKNDCRHCIPTADVVEVVRCKDCKHYKPQTGAQNWNSKVKYCCRCTVVKVKETDFCSFGERKHE
jgi:hypothetical protein